MKKKLNLDELKVQSFVTAFDVKSGETREIKGVAFSEGTSLCILAKEEVVRQKLQQSVMRHSVDVLCYRRLWYVQY